MPISVTITDSGELQATVDGVTWAPLPVAAVEALAEQVPAAKATTQQQGLLSGVRSVIDALASSGSELTASLDVTAAGVSATVDEDSFERARVLLGVEPDPETGALTKGRVVVRRRPDAPPEAAPAPVEGTAP